MQAPYRGDPENARKQEMIKKYMRFPINYQIGKLCLVFQLSAKDRKVIGITKYNAEKVEKTM